jgi:hypothetical protein
MKNETMSWLTWQEMHGEKIQGRIREILESEGLSDSYTWLDLKVVSDVLACGLTAYHINVAKHGLRSLHYPEPPVCVGCSGNVNDGKSHSLAAHCHNFFFDGRVYPNGAA